MSEKSFGIKELNLMSASGTPTIESPNDIVFKSGGSNERVRITSGGNMGVGGLASPGALLSIPAGESNTPRFAIESAVDANDFTITQYEDGNGTYTMLGQNVKLNSSGNNTILDSAHRTAAIQLDARNNGNVTFYTGAANAVGERLRITSDGNIGMGGITSPSFTTGNGLHLGDNYAIGFGAGGNSRPDFQIVTDGSSLDFRCGFGADTADISMTTGGNLVFASGGGIDFSATGDASGMSSELLDDYEEGTWTPTVRFGSGTFNGSYDTNEGFYTKIGRLVNVSCELKLSSKGSTTGTVTIEGLPFTPNSDDESRASGVVGYYQDVSNVDFPIVILIEPNQTEFPLRDSGTASATGISNGNVGNTFRIYFTITYMT